MKCPICGVWVRVLETKVKEHNIRHRRYVCGNEHRFTTAETVVKIIKPRNAKQTQQGREKIS